MNNKEFKEILSKPTIELCEKCKKCKFNENPTNKHKPCDYKYCRTDDKEYIYFNNI